MVTIEELLSLHGNLWKWRDVMDANTAFKTPVTNQDSYRFALTEIVEAMEALCLRNGEYARNHTKHFDVIEELSQYAMMTLTGLGRNLTVKFMDEVIDWLGDGDIAWNETSIDLIALCAAETNYNLGSFSALRGILIASTYPGINLPHDVRVAMNHLTLKHWKLPLDTAPLFMVE